MNHKFTYPIQFYATPHMVSTGEIWHYFVRPSFKLIPGDKIALASDHPSLWSVLEMHEDGGIVLGEIIPEYTGLNDNGYH